MHAPHVSPRDVRDMILSVVRADNRTDPATGAPYRVSKNYVRKFMRRHGIKGRKTSPIDPTRAEQATDERRDSWFDQLVAIQKRLFDEGKVRVFTALVITAHWVFIAQPLGCSQPTHMHARVPQLPSTWTTWAEVPNRCRYNYDEEAANTLKGRLPTVVSDVASLRTPRESAAMALTPTLLEGPAHRPRPCAPTLAPSAICCCRWQAAPVRFVERRQDGAALHRRHDHVRNWQAVSTLPHQVAAG